MEGQKGIEARYKELVYGTTTNYIECIDVDYKSHRDETFDHLALPVRNIVNLKASFDSFTMREILEGEN